MTILEERFMELVPNLLSDIAKSLETIAEKKQVEPKRKVYVFMAEQAWNDNIEGTIVKAFQTKEAAQKYMHDFIHEGNDESTVNYVKVHDWEVERDEPDFYRAYKEGYYCTDHIELTITECEIY